jgi:hypothetical protein
MPSQVKPVAIPTNREAFERKKGLEQQGQNREEKNINKYTANRAFDH